MRLLIPVLILGAIAVSPTVVAAASSRARQVYEPTWESLDTHRTPEWFKNAKLGVFIYSPSPTKKDWDKTKRGEYCGRNWAETKWDPNELAQLAVDTGAKYVVFAADGYSLYLSWPSSYADIKGSPFMYLKGAVPPKTDYVGELGKAVRAKGLRYGLYRNYLNWRNYPYWFETMKEMIDRYQPDTLWLDGEKLSFSAEELRSRELLAYYYNHSKKQDEVACEDTLGSHKSQTWGTRKDHADWYRKEGTPVSDEISPDHFVRYFEVMNWDASSPINDVKGPTHNYIQWLIDATSHGGNLELAIWPGPDSLYQVQKRKLRQVGDWLAVNGEGIYGTRPWTQGRAQAKTTSGVHVMFTTKQDSLYAFLMAWPSDATVVIPHLRAADGTKVSLLGCYGDLTWQQTSDGISISLSSRKADPGWTFGGAGIPCDHAWCLKITPIPTWVP